MPFVPQWERPIRIPENVPLTHAEPEYASAGEAGTWSNPVGYVWNGLAIGWRVGFTAGGDDHSGRAGTDVERGEGFYKAGNHIAPSEKFAQEVGELLGEEHVSFTPHGNGKKK